MSAEQSALAAWNARRFGRCLGSRKRRIPFAVIAWAGPPEAVHAWVERERRIGCWRIPFSFWVPSGLRNPIQLIGPSDDGFLVADMDVYTMRKIRSRRFYTWEESRLVPSSDPEIWTLESQSELFSLGTFHAQQLAEARDSWRASAQS